eukprot:889004-Amorphochlora_amoeboformis.AAC.1
MGKIDAGVDGDFAKSLSHNGKTITGGTDLENGEWGPSSQESFEQAASERESSWEDEFDDPFAATATVATNAAVVNDPFGEQTSPQPSESTTTTDPFEDEFEAAFDSLSISKETETATTQTTGTVKVATGKETVEVKAAVVDEFADFEANFK